jgi:NAD(P)-dependent dehydrogenase (short-subunit alcohol dehydrogenase family)
MRDLFSVAGKTALVTGASYGLGVTLSTALAVAGANVALAARSKDKLDDLARSISTNGNSAIALACDVTRPESVAEVVDKTWDHFGRIDVVVNNAGVSAEGGIMPEKTPYNLFDLTVRVNLMGTFYCCREAGERMLRDGKGGSIINIASIMGHGGFQGGPPAYQASKAAVINLTRNLGLSWFDRGVRVNAISPGWFPSEMTAGWFAVPDFFARFRDQSPARRVGEPSELVGPLLFLASDASSFVTGHTIAVDGGASASFGARAVTDEEFETWSGVIPEGLGDRVMPGEAADK